MSPEVTPSTNGDHIVVDADPDRGTNYDLARYDGETETSEAVATARLIERPYISDIGRVAAVVVEGPPRSDGNTYFAA